MARQAPLRRCPSCGDVIGRRWGEVTRACENCRKGGVRSLFTLEDRPADARPVRHTADAGLGDKSACVHRQGVQLIELPGETWEDIFA